MYGIWANLRSAFSSRFADTSANCYPPSVANSFAARATTAVVTLGVASTLLAGAPVEAVSPRITVDQCAQAAQSDDRYTVTDPVTGTKCVTNPDGSFALVPSEVGLGEPARFIIGFGSTTRGDIINRKKLATVYFKHKKVTIKRTARVKNGLLQVKQSFHKTGKWVMIAKYRSKMMSARFKVLG